MSRSLRRRTSTADYSFQDKVVIFLDIDGVLAPYSLGKSPDLTDDENFYSKSKPHLTAHHCWRSFSNDTIQAFLTIVESIPATDRRIVLSSSWRHHRDCRKAILGHLQAYSEANGRTLPFQHFDGTTGPTAQGIRQRQVAAWLQEHHTLEQHPISSVLKAWIVLDDKDLVNGRENRKYSDVFARHAVRPDGQQGLTGNDADRAISLLQEQMGLT